MAGGKIAKFFLLFAFLAALSACSRTPENLPLRIEKTRWERVSFDASPFVLTGFHKPIEGQSATLHVYIEGDGKAFDIKGRPTTDPTPSKPTVFNMAYNDPAANVLYLARPCQFSLQEKPKNCPERVWTSHRFSQEVIHSTNKAITLFKDKTKTTKIILIGYSGGGAVAALAAAHREDVAHLVTVAAALDHNRWMDYFKLPSLSGSLNPIDYAGKLTTLPQTHFIGLKDKVMPRGIADSYIAALKRKGGTKAPPITLIEEPYFDHQCCWAKEWQRLLDKAGLSRN